MISHTFAIRFFSFLNVELPDKVEIQMNKDLFNYSKKFFFYFLNMVSLKWFS